MNILDEIPTESVKAAWLKMYLEKLLLMAF